MGTSTQKKKKVKKKKKNEFTLSGPTSFKHVQTGLAADADPASPCPIAIVDKDAKGEGTATGAGAAKGEGDARPPTPTTPTTPTTSLAPPGVGDSQRISGSQLDAMYVLKSGMLMKKERHTLRDQWKKKWFVLRPKTLSYFKSAVSWRVHGETKPQGKITFKDDVTCRVEFSGETSMSCFSIGTLKRSIVLACPTLEERREWMEMLNYALSGCKGKIPGEDNKKAIRTASTAGDTPRPDADLAQLKAQAKAREGRAASEAKQSEGGSSEAARPNGADEAKQPEAPIESILSQPAPSPGHRHTIADVGLPSKLELQRAPSELSMLARSLDVGNILAREEAAPTESDGPGEDAEEEADEEGDYMEVERVRALYDYSGRTETEFSFKRFDQFYLIERTEGNWCVGKMGNRIGHFPATYVEVLGKEIIDVSGIVGDDGEEEEEGKEEEGMAEEEESATETSVVVVEEPAQPVESVTKKEDTPQLLVAEVASPKPKPRSASSAGQFGDYKLGDMLGKGAYGSVYKGLHLLRGNMVAIKQVDLDRINESELEATMAELSLLESLDHTNIVKYVDFVRTPKFLNIVLEFIEGGSLAVIKKKFDTIPEQLIVRYVEQVLEGLVYLHSHGVTHRDIKSANILITKEGVVKLADFGIATKIGQKHSDQGPQGSPYWMAPEVIRMEQATHTCDVWSLGCTIIELFTGKPPYFDLNPMSAMYAIGNEDKSPVPDDIEDMSPVMRSFLSFCFIRDPASRPSAAQLLQHQLFGGDGIQIEVTVGSPASVELKQVLEKAKSINLIVEEEEDDEEEEEEDEELDEAEEELRSWTKRIRELLNWFKGAMDRENVPHAIRFRTAVRKKMRELKRAHPDDDAYKPLLREARALVRRCEDEFGSEIPLDDDSDDDVDIDEDSEDFSDEGDEDSEEEFVF